MKAFRCLAFFLFTAATCIMNGPAAFAARPQTSSASQPSAVRILTPAAGEALVTDYVNVKYELVQPALSDEPNFLVQLDAADPVHTSETSQTFSDVQPGVHTIRVTLVDANNSPVQGGAATVQFKTSTAPPVRDGSRGALDDSDAALASLTPPSIPIPPELLANGDLNIPLAGSPLPLLSLIGFGLLIAGAARTMRARQRYPR
jgi:hypothetical protein